MKKICFIGGGNMGQAFVQALIENKIFDQCDVLVVERSKENCAKIVEKYGVMATQNIKDSEDYDIIFLAVKPQNLADLPDLNLEGKVVISILAGMKISQIQDKFKKAKVVRAMPNLGQFVNEGMTGYLFDDEDDFSDEEKDIVRNIFESGGRALQVDDEGVIDKITAVSGSGPAYFFYFVEKLVESAKKLGFSDEEAEMLVRQTFVGAADILRNNPDESVALWRERVTSKGGTTEAAIKNFENSDFAEVIDESMKCAEDRAVELGGDRRYLFYTLKSARVPFRRLWRDMNR